MTVNAVPVAGCKNNKEMILIQNGFDSQLTRSSHLFRIRTIRNLNVLRVLIILAIPVMS